MICSSLLMSSTMRNTWMISRLDRLSPSLKIVFKRSRKTLIGRTRWPKSGTKQEEMTQLTMVTTKLKPEVPFLITPPRPQLLKRACVHRSLRPSKRKDRQSLIGMLQLREIKKLQKIALPESWPRRFFATTQNSVAYIRQTRSKNSSKRKPKRLSLRTRVTKAQLLVLLRRKKLIRTRSILAIYPTFTRILLSD